MRWGCTAVGHKPNPSLEVSDTLGHNSCNPSHPCIFSHHFCPFGCPCKVTAADVQLPPHPNLYFTHSIIAANEKCDLKSHTIDLCTSCCSPSHMTHIFPTCPILTNLQKPLDLSQILKEWVYYLEEEWHTQFRNEIF